MRILRVNRVVRSSVVRILRINKVEYLGYIK